MRTLFAVFLVIAWVPHCPASEIAVPNTNYLQTAPGNGSGFAPFLVFFDAEFPSESARYQQVYAASEFADFPAGGGLITGFRLRAGVASPGFGVPGVSDVNLQNIQISFSTTAKEPDSLSPVFAENTGSGETAVLGPGSLSIRSFGGMGGLAGQWDVIIPFSTPFHYRPSDGNLLMDVRTFVGSPAPFPPPFPWPPYLDGVFTLGDSVSAVRAYTGNGSGSVDSTSGVPTTFGFTTLFEFVPIPEPSSVLLLVVAGTLLMLCRRREERN